jgi:predicted ATPase/transcriptional regulator with XRE-family HTH domain
MAAKGSSQFADLLRRFRRRSGLTQEELAERAGLSPSAVSQLERGLTQAPHKDTVQFLITALDLSTDDAASLAQAARRLRSITVDTAPSAPASASAVPTPHGTSISATTAPSPRETASPLMQAYRLAPPLTPLLGREHEEAGAVHLLTQEHVRLLTLTGPAGVGKTRLALQVATTLREQHGFELAFVNLVAASAPDQVPQIIAQALGVRETGGLSLLDAMTAAIGGRRLLLTLDNFEHVLPAAPLCAALLGACPGAKGLVTSRAALNIRGEHEFAVAPLRVPDLSELPPLDDLQRYGAVALFLERARAARPDFVLGTLERGRLVASICARLDGLPLAIELAAAQVRRFTLEDLATRLQGVAPLDVLVGGPRDLAEHQRAMRSTVAWSYGLLSPDEQRVFRALGVFAGGATVDGVRLVAGLDEERVAASLISLVDASQVFRADLPDDQHGHQPGETRYDLLVIVRAFAVERLAEAGEMEEARRRLADYLRELVEQLSPSVGWVQTALLNRLVREHDNLRAVLDWLLERGELQIALRLTAHLRVYWESRGLVAEGAAWLERLLARTEPARTPDELEAQVEAWKVLVVIRHRQGRFQQAAEAADRVLALTHQQNNPAKVAQALHYLANPLVQLGELDRAEALLLESLAIHRAEGNRTDEMVDLINLGELRSFQGRYEEALAIQQEALAISRSLAEQEPSLGLILANLGETYILMDRPAEALEVLLESQVVFDARGEQGILGLYPLGRACWRLGASSEALEYLERATQLSRRQDDMAALVQELSIVAGVALDRGDLTLARQALEEASAAQVRVLDQRVRWRLVERAAGYACRLGAWEVAVRLYAAAERGRSRTHDLVDPAECELRARDRAMVLAALGPDTISAAEHSEGVVTLPHALDLARTAFMKTRPD